jgi:hypothetical protein
LFLYRLLSLRCSLDRLDGTPSEFTDAIDRGPKCARKARDLGL